MSVSSLGVGTISSATDNEFVRAALADDLLATQIEARRLLEQRNNSNLSHHQIVLNTGAADFSTLNSSGKYSSSQKNVELNNNINNSSSMLSGPAVPRVAPPVSTGLMMPQVSSGLVNDMDPMAMEALSSRLSANTTLQQSQRSSQQNCLVTDGLDDPRSGSERPGYTDSISEPSVSDDELGVQPSAVAMSTSKISSVGVLPVEASVLSPVAMSMEASSPLASPVASITSSVDASPLASPITSSRLPSVASSCSQSITKNSLNGSEQSPAASAASSRSGSVVSADVAGDANSLSASNSDVGSPRSQHSSDAGEPKVGTPTSELGSGNSSASVVDATDDLAGLGAEADDTLLSAPSSQSVKCEVASDNASPAVSSDNKSEAATLYINAGDPESQRTSRFSLHSLRTPKVPLDVVSPSIRQAAYVENPEASLPPMNTKPTTISTPLESTGRSNSQLDSPPVAASPPPRVTTTTSMNEGTRTPSGPSPARPAPVYEEGMFDAVWHHKKVTAILEAAVQEKENTPTNSPVTQAATPAPSPPPSAPAPPPPPPPATMNSSATLEKKSSSNVGATLDTSQPSVEPVQESPKTTTMSASVENEQVSHRSSHHYSSHHHSHDYHHHSHSSSSSSSYDHRHHHRTFSSSSSSSSDSFERRLEALEKAGGSIALKPSPAPAESPRGRSFSSSSSPSRRHHSYSSGGSSDADAGHRETDTHISINMDDSPIAEGPASRQSSLASSVHSNRVAAYLASVSGKSSMASIAAAPDSAKRSSLSVPPPAAAKDLSVSNSSISEASQIQPMDSKPSLSPAGSQTNLSTNRSINSKLASQSSSGVMSPQVPETNASVESIKSSNNNMMRTGTASSVGSKESMQRSPSNTNSNNLQYNASLSSSSKAASIQGSSLEGVEAGNTSLSGIQAADIPQTAPAGPPAYFHIDYPFESIRGKLGEWVYRDSDANAGVEVRMSMARKTSPANELVHVLAITVPRLVSGSGIRTAAVTIQDTGSWKMEPIDPLQKEKSWSIHKERLQYMDNEKGSERCYAYFFRSIWTGDYDQLLPLQFIVRVILRIFGVPLPDGFETSPIVERALNTCYGHSCDIEQLFRSVFNGVGFSEKFSSLPNNPADLQREANNYTIITSDGMVTCYRPSQQLAVSPLANSDKTSSVDLDSSKFSFLGYSENDLASFLVRSCLLPGCSLNSLTDLADSATSMALNESLLDAFTKGENLRLEESLRYFFWNPNVAINTFQDTLPVSFVSFNLKSGLTLAESILPSETSALSLSSAFGSLLHSTKLSIAQPLENKPAQLTALEELYSKFIHMQPVVSDTSSASTWHQTETAFHRWACAHQCSEFRSAYRMFESSQNFSVAPMSSYRTDTVTPRIISLYLCLNALEDRSGNCQYYSTIQASRNSPADFVCPHTRNGSRQRSLASGVGNTEYPAFQNINQMAACYESKTAVPLLLTAISSSDSQQVSKAQLSTLHSGFRASLWLLQDLFDISRIRQQMPHNVLACQLGLTSADVTGRVLSSFTAERQAQIALDQPLLSKGELYGDAEAVTEILEMGPTQKADVSATKEIKKSETNITTSTSHARGSEKYVYIPALMTSQNVGVSFAQPAAHLDPAFASVAYLPTSTVNVSGHHAPTSMTYVGTSLTYPPTMVTPQQHMMVSGGPQSQVLPPLGAYQMPNKSEKSRHSSRQRELASHTSAHSRHETSSAGSESYTEDRTKEDFMYATIPRQPKRSSKHHSDGKLLLTGAGLVNNTSMLTSKQLFFVGRDRSAECLIEVDPLPSQSEREPSRRAIERSRKKGKSAVPLFPMV